MSRSAIRSAITQAYDDGDFGVPTAFEGKYFEKPVNAPWAETTLMPVSSDQSLQTVDKEKFLFQIDLNFPQNNGTRPLEDVADAITSYFAPRRLFFAAPQRVRVLTRDVSRVRDSVAGWQVCSISVVFSAATDR